MSFLDFWKRPIVVVDVETTRPDYLGAVVDLGAVIVDPNLVRSASFSQRIMPEKDGELDPGALRVNGYNRETWKKAGALSISDGMKGFVKWLGKHRADDKQKYTFASWNVTFDWLWILQGLDAIKSDPDYIFDWHRIDLFTFAACTVGVGPDADTIRIGSDGVRAALGLKMEPTPHRALVGAKLESEVLVKLLQLLR